MNIAIDEQAIISIVRFFVPGYWMLVVYKFASGRKQEKATTFPLSLAYGYILNVLVGGLHKLKTQFGIVKPFFSLVDPEAVNFVVALFTGTVLALFFSYVYNASWFSDITKKFFNQTPGEDIWRDVINYQDGAAVVFREKDTNHQIAGSLRHLERDDNDVWFAISGHYRIGESEGNHEEDNDFYYITRMSNLDSIEIQNPIDQQEKANEESESAKKCPKKCSLKQFWKRLCRRKNKKHSEVDSMSIVEKYEFELNEIKRNLEILKTKQIYEVTNLRGTPSVTTVGERLQKKIASLLYKIENNQPGDVEIAESYLKNMEEERNTK